MLIERILDSSDPRLSVFQNLKDKDLKRGGQFIVEGKFILETLLTRSRFKTYSVLISENRIEPLKPLFSRIEAPIPVYVVSSQLIEKIAGYDVHRGILAAGICDPSQNILPANLTDISKIAVLSNIANPDNIGAIFRNAAGLGIETVILDLQCCSPLYRKATRVSMGATLVLPWVQGGSVENIIANLHERGFSSYALSLQSAERLEDVQFGKRCAFVFGEEAYGLAPHVQRLCKAVTIPMANGTDSLNVAATSAIVFDAARRQMK